ncbi:MAG: hypothetical protein HOV66_02650, partial [Streptomycetaceae bacterium]|nr:hypothetical protein [Streptomycetaceae bacterium]
TKYVGTLRAYNTAQELSNGRASMKGMAAASYELIQAENRQEAAAKRVAEAEKTRASAVRSTLSGAGKAAGVVAGLAVATSGVADKMGLTNTASLALMGTIAGPWGAAIGGGVGLVMDLAAANNDLTTAMDQANRAARDGVQIQQQRQAYRDLQAEIADATGKVNDFNYLFQAHGDKSATEYFKSLPSAFKGAGIAITGGTRDAQSALDALDAKMNGTSDLAGLLGQSFGMTGRQAAIAAGNVTQLSGALEVLAGWLDKRAALRGFEASLDALTAGMKKNSHAWSDTTEKGRANLDLLDATARGIVQVATQLKNPTVRANFLAGARRDLVAMADKFPGARKQVHGLLRELDGLGLTHAKPKVDVDTKGAEGKTKRVRHLLDDLDREHPKPTVDSNTKPAEGKWQRLFGLGRRLDGMKPTPRVDSDTRSALSKWQTVFGMGHKLDAFVANPKVHADTSQAFSAINAVRYALAALHDKTISIHTVQTTSYLSKRAGIPMPSAEGSTVPDDGGPYADRFPYLLAPREEVTSNRFRQADNARKALKLINAGRLTDRMLGLADGGTVRGLAGGGTATSSSSSSSSGSGKNAPDPETVRQLKHLHGALKNATKALKEETAERDKLKQRQQQVRQAVMDGLRSDLFAAPDNVWAAGAGNPIAILRADLARTRTFNRSRDTLARKGLDGMALQEVLENPDQAQMMAGMSRKQLAEFERLYARRQRLTRGAAVGATGVLGIDRHLAESVHEMRQL